MNPHPLTLPQGMRYDAGVSKEMVLENTDVNRSNRPDSAVLSCPNSVPSFGQDGESGNASRTTLTGVFNILPTLRLKTPGDLKVSSTEHDMPSPKGALAPIKLHTLYHSNLACNFHNDLTLRVHQAQGLAGSLRSIQAISAILIATADEESIDLGPWMRSGLIEAINTITWAMSSDLETINERASKAQGEQA